jgi:hypothetical protein
MRRLAQMDILQKKNGVCPVGSDARHVITRILVRRASIMSQPHGTPSYKTTIPVNAQTASYSYTEPAYLAILLV